MNKLDKLFIEKQKNLLSLYFTAGYPNLNDTNEILSSVENYGADLVEIGIPFSDPVADGPVIQFSNSASIENGMTLKILFDQLRESKLSSKIPKILMGYFNPIFKYGVDDFCKSCNDVGIDGVIIPDLPLAEFEEKYQKKFKDNGIHFIFLVSPQTSLERLRQIDKLSNSFVYAVSTNSTTGGELNFESQKEYFQRLKNELTNPFLIGFGVKDRKSFQSASKYANGAIVGSAFIKALSENGELKSKIKNFIKQIKNEYDYSVRERHIN